MRAPRSADELRGVPSIVELEHDVVFQAPWEARAFAMVLAMVREGKLSWGEFSNRLIAEIAAADPEAPYNYYELWLKAFEKLLTDKRVFEKAELESKLSEVAQVVPSDDHAHSKQEGSKK